MTGLVHLAALIACAAPIEPGPDQLVRDLGNPSYTVREQATRALWKLGEKARPALTAVLKSPDAEVARRAQEILEKFDWGILPDTPADVLKQIRAYRSAIPERQYSAIVALVKLGEPAVPTLRALLSRDLPPQTRAEVFDYLAGTLRQEVPRLLLANKTELSESLLALNALGPSDAGLIDYALYLHLRGHAKTAASELEKVKAASGPRSETDARALVFLYRAAGDADRARAAAKALDEAGKLTGPERFGVSHGNLYESLLEDTGAWAELTDRPIPRANSVDGLKIFRLRMAGRIKEANEIADLQKDAGDSSHGDGPDEATLALMLNQHPLEGIDRLKARHNAPHILADVLAARLQFQEALDLVTAEKFDEASGLDARHLRQLYATRKGRLLAQLGERDSAAQVFGQVAERVNGGDGAVLNQLLRAEVRSGRYDLACEHLGRSLAFSEEGSGGRRDFSTSQDPFELIFDMDADAAQYWWRVLRHAKRPGEPAGETMRQVRALLIGTAMAAERDHALKAAGRDKMPLESPEGQNRALALAVVYRAAGKTEDAIATLAEVADRLNKAADDGGSLSASQPYAAGSRGWVFGIDERFRFWVELGDLLSEQGRHQDAATRLEQGWHKYPDNPVLLYLAGRARIKAGDEKEGRRRIELSHWIALGSARLRGRFLEELVSRGAMADVKRERDLAREAGWVSEDYIGNVWNQIARASVLMKDYDTAASANRRAIHYLLRKPHVSYVEGFAYLTVPQGVRGYAARSLLAAGKVDEAVALAKDCLTVMPGYSDLVIAMVPELDRLGHKKEADELFRQVWNTYAEIIRAHPNSGWARYSASWLAAGCRRELDTALTHAKKAAELDPNLRPYKEALAEVHFRRGERDQAVGLMRELIAADRRNHHYKRQLDRYQTGDVTSPLLDADDD